MIALALATAVSAAVALTALGLIRYSRLRAAEESDKEDEGLGRR